MGRVYAVVVVLILVVLAFSLMPDKAPAEIIGSPSDLEEAFRPVDSYVGTSGYNYKGWKGPFYPKRFPDKEMLGFYGERFNTVEINNSFYRVPKPDVVKSWARSVPDTFRFVMKATRRITHFKRLKEVSEETEYFLTIAANLKDRLGAILFQLPPNLKKDVPRLQAFLDLLPETVAVTLEFRHDSWFDQEVHDCLRSKNVALCFSHEDDDGDEEVERKFASTANWGYLRLRGSEYGDTEMKQLVDRVQGQNWERVFVFFKHEEDGLGPKLAKRFTEAAAEL